MDKFSQLNHLENRWKSMSDNKIDNPIVVRQKLMAAQELVEFVEKHIQLHDMQLTKEDQLLLNEAKMFELLYGNKLVV